MTAEACSFQVPCHVHASLTADMSGKLCTQGLEALNQAIEGDEVVLRILSLEQWVHLKDGALPRSADFAPAPTVQFTCELCQLLHLRTCLLLRQDDVLCEPAKRSTPLAACKCCIVKGVVKAGS